MRIAGLTVLTLLAAALAMPMTVVSADAAAHIGGEGHGDGIDAVYTDTDYSLLSVKLLKRPIDRVNVILTSEHDTPQKVEKLQVDRDFIVELRPLKAGTYGLQIGLHGTGDIIAECDLIIGASYTITLSPGEGAGDPEVHEIMSGTSYTLPGCMFDAPYGKEFTHWSYCGVGFSAGDVVKVDDGYVFTAVYQDIPEPVPGPANDNDDGTPVIIAGIAVVAVLLISIMIAVMRRRS